MAYTTEQYNALTAAIAQGATTVQYGDKRVEYRSLNEMMRIKGQMEEELGLTKRANRKVYPVFNKGLYSTE